LEQAQVESELVQRGTQPGKRADDLVILPAGIDLGGDREEGQFQFLGCLA